MKQTIPTNAPNTTQQCSLRGRTNTQYGPMEVPSGAIGPSQIKWPK